MTDWSVSSRLSLCAVALELNSSCHAAATVENGRCLVWPAGGVVVVLTEEAGESMGDGGEDMVGMSSVGVIHEVSSSESELGWLGW